MNPPSVSPIVPLVRGSAANDVAAQSPVADLLLARASAYARVAVYDAPGCAPQTEDVALGSPRDFIDQTSARVTEIVRQLGGSIPYTVIRELVENFVHAGFAEPTISILHEGRVVRFSDRGPGFADKCAARLPGFTTAAGPARDLIRGVGSGLSVVSDFLALRGGTLTIEDNLGSGAVVTVDSRAEEPPTRPISTNTKADPPSSRARSLPSGVRALDTDPSLFGTMSTHRNSLSDGTASPTSPLSQRQRRVLGVVVENEIAGPSIVSSVLSIGLSTAYRDLGALEERGLIVSVGGKRTATHAGRSYLQIEPL